jgi:hypothetical protein
MITKEKFKTYTDIQEGGETNMFNIKNVIALSDYELDKEDCLDIMKNYDGYKNKFVAEK